MSVNVIAPKYKRKVKHSLDGDYVIFREIGGYLTGQDSKGRARYRWDTDAVAISLTELREMAERYLPK